jgi:hypothetical protein
MAEKIVIPYPIPPGPPGVLVPAAFDTAALVGLGSRRVDKVFEIEDLDVFPGPSLGVWNLRLCAESFFANLGGSDGRLLVKTFVASDAVQASKTFQDTAGAPADTLTLKASYRGEPDKSAFGNKIGATLENGYRFQTTAAAPALLGATELELDAIIDVKIGDVLEITSSGPVTHYAKVSDVNEGAGKVTVSATTNPVAALDPVKVKGYKITAYVKNARGADQIAQVPENDLWLSHEPESPYYIETQYVSHDYVTPIDTGSASPLEDSWPADIPDPVYLENGADGSSPSDSDWKNELEYFNALGPRWIANAESNTRAANKNGEFYCSQRSDKPLWMNNIPRKTTKQEYIAYGQALQRSNQVYSFSAGSTRNWSDPIVGGANPVRLIPVHAAVMGRWINAIDVVGPWRAPAGKDFPLIGFAETKTTDDDYEDMEDLRDAGINLTQVDAGDVTVNYNRSMSTSVDYRNGINFIMLNYIALTIAEAFGREGGRPSTLDSVLLMQSKIRSLLLDLWDGGGLIKYQKADGTESTFEDVAAVQGGPLLNTPAKIALGEVNFRIFISPAGVQEKVRIGLASRIPIDIRV